MKQNTIFIVTVVTLLLVFMAGALVYKSDRGKSEQSAQAAERNLTLFLPDWGRSRTVDIQLPREDSSEREIFTHEEVQKMVDTAPTVEWQTLILLGYFIGARLTDCAVMKWENVNPDEGIIVFHQGKTGKKVTVPMHFHIIEHLKYLSTFGTSGPLSPKLAARATGGKHGLSESFKRIVIKAGVDPMVVRGKGTQNFTKRTFHSLRHSFNSHLANAGVAEEVRMKLTGHSSKVMNSRYTHLEVATLKNAVKSLPLFGQPSAESK